MTRLLTIIGAAVTALLISQVHAAGADAATFKLRYSTGFGGAVSHRIWTVYKGKPRCCTSHWSASHVTTHGGVLTIDASRDNGAWTSGGLSMGRSLNQRYGAWSIRFRMDPGVGVKMCALLWPQAGWPPEIDFAENSSADGARRVISSTLHYSSANRMIHHKLALNYQKWHTMGVRWTPHKISYRMDGRQWASITGHIPTHKMHLGIQTTVGLSNGNGSGPNSSTPAHVGLHLDWVRVWKYVG